MAVVIAYPFLCPNSVLAKQPYASETQSVQFLSPPMAQRSPTLLPSVEASESWIHERDIVTSLDTLKVPVFSRIRMFAGGMITPASLDTDPWTPEVGVSVWMSTPFYVGDLELGAGYSSWTAVGDILPDYSAVEIVAGWSVSTSPENAVKLSSGVTIGNYFMVFDSEQISGERKESELIIMPFFRARRTLLGSLEGFIQVQVAGIYTNPTMTLIQTWAGLSMSMESPAWLGRIFR